MIKRLIVISGEANTGKMPLARALAEQEYDLVIVHRDDFRKMFVNPVDENHITYAMNATTKSLLAHGYSVIVVAWNMEKTDMDMWTTVAKDFQIPLVWLDARTPEVQRLIPPMEEKENA